MTQFLIATEYFLSLHGLLETIGLVSTATVAQDVTYHHIFYIALYYNIALDSCTSRTKGFVVVTLDKCIFPCDKSLINISILCQDNS